MRLEVRVENETVWLNRQQLAMLFNRDIKTIGKHITNALKEECQNSVVAKFATTADDGKKYQVEHYDLDIILSVGYRVKSANGIKFRRWANQVLKDYMLKGYVIRQRKISIDLEIADLVKSAKRSVVFIDPFATIEVLKFAAMRAKGVQAVVYSARITPEFRAAADLHKKQYPGLDLKTMRTIHDRFLLVDDKVYHFGASFIKYEGREQRQCLH